MKKLILMLAFILMAVICSAQDSTMTKFRATAVSYSLYDDKVNDWGEFTEWEDDASLFVLDVEQQTFTRYTQGNNKYTWNLYSVDNRVGPKGSDMYVLYGVDDVGHECEIQLRYYQDGTKQIYACYANLVITVWSVKVL